MNEDTVAERERWRAILDLVVTERTPGEWCLLTGDGIPMEMGAAQHRKFAAAIRERDDE